MEETTTNRAIKLYFYIYSGVSILNDFRNLFLGIFAAYFALKLNNPILLVLMFFFSLPVLVVVGYINVHKISKVKEWLSVKFGTHYGIQQFDYVKKTAELLEEINKKL